MAYVQNYDSSFVYDLELFGEGSFGKVYKAKMFMDAENESPEVALKIVKTDYCSAISEINRMIHLSHHNVVKLLGVIYPEDNDYSYCENGEYEFEDCNVPWLIMEFMPYGNLRDYVRSFKKGCPGIGMVYMSYGIACGMDYLHRSVNIVHRDLAARNILVGYNWEVKIADFGLCSDYNEGDYYYGVSDRPCPIRWMPPENVPGTGVRFSRKGDVWSFGVVLFEIWSRGQTPFEALADAEVIQTLFDGYTPLHYYRVKARPYIVQLMWNCWSPNPQNRPDFWNILNRFVQHDPQYFQLIV